MKQRILIVEDDGFVSGLLASCMENAGYLVSTAISGKEMYEVLETKAVHLMLLDLSLPDEDGLVLARKIRAKSNLPIIVLTSREEEADRLAALEIGADDYMTKPCNVKELTLRVRNLLARSHSIDLKDILDFNGWHLDNDSGTLKSPEGEEHILPRTEFDLLCALLKANERVLSRGFLIDAINRGEDSASERMIDVLISRLRKKIEIDPKKPQIIQTIPGQGYRLKK